MNACDAVREILPAYTDGELSQDRRAPLERHLEGCPACRDELTVLNRDERLLRAVIGRRVPANPTINARVWAVVDRDRRTVRPDRRASIPENRPSTGRSGIFRLPVFRIWGFAGAVAVAVLFVALFIRQPGMGPTDMRIAGIAGNPFWKPAKSGDWLPLKEGLILRAGDSIRTDLNARVLSEWKDGSKARLENGGESSVLYLFPGVELKSGRLAVAVRKRQSREAPFTVRSIQATVQVMGTKFTVEVPKGGGYTAVMVYQGRVHLFNDKGSMTVTEYTRSVVLRGRAPSAPAPFSPLLDKGMWNL